MDKVLLQGHVSCRGWLSILRIAAPRGPVMAASRSQVGPAPQDVGIGVGYMIQGRNRAGGIPSSRTAFVISIWPNSRCSRLATAVAYVIRVPEFVARLFPRLFTSSHSLHSLLHSVFRPAAATHSFLRTIFIFDLAGHELVPDARYCELQSLSNATQCSEGLAWGLDKNGAF